MNKYEILEILYDWNFWERSQFLGVKRKELLKTLSKLSSENFIISIIGPRRSGKSVLIRQFANELIVKGTNPRDILIVNFEDYKWKDLNLDTLDKIYSVYLENINISDKPYIFLDEVQRISGWERFVRTLLEKRKGHIFVSSSNSKILNKELATLLTGRNLTMEVFPLSFVEFLKFKKIIISEKLDIIAHRTEIARFFEEYLEWGGFPEVSLSKNKKLILQQYFEDILSKDISERYKVRRKDKLETLAKFYLSNISGKITFRKVENFLKISLATVERFSGYLSEAYLIFFIKKFSFSVKEQDNSPRKVYSCDIGTANSLGFRFSRNTGKIYENIVAIELKRQMKENKELEFFYWQNGDGVEVDFIIKEGTGISQAIQVTTDISSFKVREREIRGFIRGLEKFKLDKGTIITEDHKSTKEIKGKIINYIPLWKWLLRTWSS